MSFPLVSMTTNSALTNLVVQANNPQSYLSTIPKDLVIYLLADRTTNPDNFISEMRDLKNNHSTNPIAVKVANYLLHKSYLESKEIQILNMYINLKINEKNSIIGNDINKFSVKNKY